jgi:hypothetical protein
LLLFGFRSSPVINPPSDLIVYWTVPGKSRTKASQELTGLPITHGLLGPKISTTRSRGFLGFASMSHVFDHMLLLAKRALG